MTAPQSEPSSAPSAPPTPSSADSSRIVADGGGLRYNTGKPPLELVPPEMLWAFAAVASFGEKNGYPRRNWERGMNWSICYGCALRHLLKWWQRHAADTGDPAANKPGSGLSHLYHALWNIAALVTYEDRKIGTDDRP